MAIFAVHASSGGNAAAKITRHPHQSNMPNSDAYGGFSTATPTIRSFKSRIALSSPMSDAEFWGEPNIFYDAKSTVGLIPSSIKQHDGQS